MPRNKHIQTLLNVKDVGLVEVVTVEGLARVIGKSRSTVLRYEKLGIFPLAPLKVRDNRYYPLALAKKLIPLVSKIPNGRKVDPQLVVEINKAFKEERNKLCPKK